MQRLLSNVRTRLRAVMVVTATAVMVMGNVASVAAASLSDVSLELSDPRPSEIGVTYDLNAGGFTTGTTILCLQVEFDTQADGAGGKPAGMDLTSAAASSNTIQAALTTQTIDDPNGILQYTDAAGGVPAASGELVVDAIVNPNTEAEFFAIITTFTDASCTGGNEVDSLTIAWVTKNGEPVQLVIDPNLTFVCNAVLTGVAVNGINTTHPSTASGVDYNAPVDVTSAANGISAHSLDVTTNASGGYVVYIRHVQDFQNSAADVIPAHAGTNAAPTAFSAAGTEAWGYTTEDVTLTTGTAARFAAGNWAGFTSTNEPIIDNPSTTAGTDTTLVGHQVGISASTPAGTYNTEIIYTIVATY